MTAETPDTAPIPSLTSFPNSVNRYSMPVTRSRGRLYDLDQTNTARFLFGEDDDNSEAKQYQAGSTDDFPTLTRREGQTSMVCHKFFFTQFTSWERECGRSERARVTCARPRFPFSLYHIPPRPQSST
jgi:hypothetical protein